MKSKGAIHALYQIRCIKLGLTRDQAAEHFKCSWQFLLSVLTYKRPMPEWMVSKMAEFLDIEKGMIGIAFGYYPMEWMSICQEAPDTIHKGIQNLLKGLKPIPDLSLGSHRGKPLSSA